MARNFGIRRYWNHPDKHRRDAPVGIYVVIGTAIAAIGLAAVLG
jgi:hypothetical protein